MVKKLLAIEIVQVHTSELSELYQEKYRSQEVALNKLEKGPPPGIIFNQLVLLWLLCF